jgi:hypothetical protein
MDGNLGVIRINLHKIKQNLDSNNQVASNSFIEKIVSIKDGEKCLKSTITNNVATVVEEGYTEGDEVDMWVTCVRSTEGGSICEQNYVQADEDTWQSYLDAQ